ncbi:PTS sugar transporter subunit IIA [Streptococcus hohhotensis]|uniref:PTS fructose transporter subunit IIA n=1 Tax=Streptococcus hohhotensis TaxID=2866998 RepID=A0ABT6QF51_9STRE|nr:PTS fructose transporter subunit IIA [Streptococcus sp. IMAU 99199]MDI2140101.1 PTS fructose transporter subunit IIA [Streptococcus sp. IMAU 99199]
MKYLILVSHGGLAEGLKSSLSMFASDKVDDVIAIGLKDGESLADFSVEVKNVIGPLNENDSVLVLADIVGGSPLTTVATVLEEFGKLENATILGGMNLTMALTAVVMKDILTGSELVSTILNESSSALQEFEVGSDDNLNEEDDI